MAVTQYIGSRYVPLFADPAEWSSAKTYEPLTIVLHQGNSYTSKQFVPKGIGIDNETYWAETGNYNAQVEQYRQETLQALNAATTAQNDIDTLLPKADFSASNTVKNFILDQNKQVPAYANVTPYMQTVITPDKRAQGGCIYNNVVYYIETIATDNTTPAELYARSLINGSIIARNTTQLTGHCNGMTYNTKTNKIVIAGVDKSDGNNYSIYIVNPYNLQLEREIVPEYNILNIAYDADRDLYYGMSLNYIYIINTNFEIVDRVNFKSSAVNNISWQDACYYNDYLYALYTPSQTVVCINVNNWTQTPCALNLKSIIEIEFCDFVNDQLYIGAVPYKESYLCIYTTTISNATLTKSFFDGSDTQTYYVDYNNDTTIGDGSANRPVGCLSSVLGIYNRKVIVNVSGTQRSALAYSFNNFEFSYFDNLVIFGHDFVVNMPIEFNFNNRIYISGVTFNESCNGLFSNFLITNCKFTKTAAGQSQAALYLRDCIAEVSNTDFTESLAYQISSHNTVLYTANCTFNDSATHGCYSDWAGSINRETLYTGNSGASWINPRTYLHHTFDFDIVHIATGVHVRCHGYWSDNKIRFFGCYAGASGISVINGTIATEDAINYSVDAIAGMINGSTFNNVADRFYIASVVGE